ncbi:MAG: PAS domain S-box protein, partial [Hymenobacter sp.]
LVWTATPDGLRNYFNARWLTYTGTAPAANLGEGWLEALHPDDRERVHQQWRAAVASGQPYQVEYRLRRHDGEYRWMLSRATADHAPTGEVRLWVGGVVDVHEERRMVREILEANEEQAVLSDQAYQNFKLVQQQRHMLYNLLLHAPAYIAITRGPEHRYEFVSEQFMRLTDGRPVIGRTVAEVYPETVGQGLIKVLDQILTTGRPYQGAGITSYAYDVTELVRLRQQLASRPAGPSA